MKIVRYYKYGPPSVLKIEETDKPVPLENEVLIKVKAASVSSEDCTFRSGNPFVTRVAMGLFKPKNPVLGQEFAGIVEEVGKEVKQFKPGDRVFGPSGLNNGSYAEYITLPENDAFTVIPEGMSFEEAAARCGGILTALPFLRDEGKLQEGQKVLINGASGSVGSAAVQLAKRFGAEVTGVCGTENVSLVRSLGADRVINYQKEDFTKLNLKFDLVFDAVGKSSFPKSKSILTEKGIYLSTVLNPSIVYNMIKTSKSTGQRAKIAFTGLRNVADKRKYLEYFDMLNLQNKFDAVIDRTFVFEDVAAAHEYVGRGHKKGNVVLKME